MNTTQRKNAMTKARTRSWFRPLLLVFATPLGNQQFTISSGHDLSKTAYAYKLFDLDPIPANAFGAGSDPFTASIDWTSGPLTDFMGFSLPDNQVDTVVFRPADAVLSGPGSSTTIPVQMVALSFVAVRPITVTFNGGTQTELWDVAAEAPDNPVGIMTIAQTSVAGGVFDSVFHVHPVLTFTRVSDGFQITIDTVASGLPPNIVQQENIPWRFEPIDPPPTANHEILRIAGLTTNFVPGYTEIEGRILMIGAAFHPTNPQGQARGEHGHFVSAPIIRTMTPICLPGQRGIILCPCSNPPAGGGLGCDNFGAGPFQSGTLDASGTRSLAADTVVLNVSGENNTSFTVFWTGKNPASTTGLPHGAGVRCITNSLKRLYAGSASGGAISRPGGGDPSVSARTAAVGSPISAGETRHYFNIYRDPNAAGPCGSPATTTNLTNAGSITWYP